MNIKLFGITEGSWAGANFGVVVVEVTSHLKGSDWVADKLEIKGS